VLLVIVVAVLAVVCWRRRKPERAQARAQRGLSVLLVSVILALNIGLVTPASAAQAGCGQAPAPERPGSGAVGWLDPPAGNGEPDSPYRTYGYAGMVWNVYEIDCGPLSFISIPARIGNWFSNQLFDSAKILVGITNSLHYTLIDGWVLGGFNEKISTAAHQIYGILFGGFASLALLVVALAILRKAIYGDLPGASKRGFLTLVALWLAASSVGLVPFYRAIDNIITQATQTAQAGFANPNDNHAIRDAFPTKLHTAIVYEGWLRGEFGNPTSPQATQFGRPLLDAQAWTWEDIQSGKDTDTNAENAKKDQYTQIATQLGPATDYFTGKSGVRIGAGFLALLQALAYSAFPFIANFMVLVTHTLLRIFTLTGPIIGLAALVNPEILRTVGKTTLTLLHNLALYALLAGVYTKFLDLILSDQSKIPLIIQIALAATAAAILAIYANPIKRTKQIYEQTRQIAHAARNTHLPRFPRGVETMGSTPGPRRGPRPEGQTQGQEAQAEQVLTPDPVRLVTSATKGVAAATEHIDKYRAEHQVRKRQTIGVAEYEINGNIGEETSTSGYREYPSAVPMPEDPTFDPGDREADAEWKILEYIVKKLNLKQSPSATGRIHITVEREPCPSCLRVLIQFHQRFRGVRITYTELGRDKD
jgi:hypothetical protein